ncbi:hypothetical protein QFZ79_000312 [Arthrobacter sp. V4I6]|uniref:DUF6318 family protein n=1 Tax=unclassified Arthrobacter TaxID=235627 RepID=UPI0027881A35|nr:hypothetical protein [Arthrobacter sp. V1I7]MDQ0852201.1 hypothetical protein [Arthrobacter sp. V4I6]
MTSRTSSSTSKCFRSAALVVALLISASACNGGGVQPAASPPAESQSPSAASTPSATPTPTPSYKPADASGRAQNVPVPVLPEVAKSETKEGLEAFARYWFQLLSYGYETGDTGPLESVTSPACSPCGTAKSDIIPWHQEGRWLIGGQITTPAVETTFSAGADGIYKVAVQVHQVPLTYVRADGSVAQKGEQKDDTGNLLLVAFRNNTWHVDDVGSIVG